MISIDTVATAIRQVTEQVFSTMLELEVRAGEPRLVRDLGATAEGVISLIGMAGAWVGTGSLALSASLACKISSRLLLWNCGCAWRPVSSPSRSGTASKSRTA